MADAIRRPIEEQPASYNAIIHPLAGQSHTMLHNNASKLALMPLCPLTCIIFISLLYKHTRRKREREDEKSGRLLLLSHLPSKAGCAFYQLDIGRVIAGLACVLRLPLLLPVVGWPLARFDPLALSLWAGGTGSDVAGG